MPWLVLPSSRCTSILCVRRVFSFVLYACAIALFASELPSMGCRSSVYPWQVVNKIYAEYFPVNPPARAAFAVAALPAGAAIEIECVCALE